MADSPEDVRHRTFAKGRIRPQGENSPKRRKFVRKAKIHPKGESLRLGGSFGGHSASRYFVVVQRIFLPLDNI
jgi:hypothetical protein